MPHTIQVGQKLEIVFDDDFQLNKTTGKPSGIQGTFVGLGLRAFNPGSQFLPHYTHLMLGRKASVTVIEVTTRGIKVSQREACAKAHDQFVAKARVGQRVLGLVTHHYGDGSFEVELECGAIATLPGKLHTMESVQAKAPQLGDLVTLEVYSVSVRYLEFHLSYRDVLLNDFLDATPRDQIFRGRVREVTAESVVVEVGELLLTVPMVEVTDDPASLDFSIGQEVPLLITSIDRRHHNIKFSIKRAVVQTLLTTATPKNPVAAKVLKENPDGSRMVGIKQFGVTIHETLARSEIWNIHLCTVGAIIGITVVVEIWHGLQIKKFKQAMASPSLVAK